MINVQNYKKRRQLLFSYMKNNSLALIFSASELTRNNDIKYPFYQESNFWYFTGFNEPKSLLVLIKKNEKDMHSIIFNQSCNEKHKLWFGNCLGQQNAIKTLGVDFALSWNNINKKLYLLLRDIDIVYHAKNLSKKADYYFLYAIKKLKLINNNKNITIKIKDWRPFVHNMRLFKTNEEINILRKAGKISSLAHIRAIKSCKPGLYEYFLEGEIKHEFNYHGVRFLSYNTIIASGKNSLVLHYSDNKCKLKNGNLVLIDAGCELERYACDLTRTIPINGKFTNDQLSIYNIVLKSLYKALSMCHPGILISEIKKEVIYIIVNGLLKLDILKGNVNDLIEQCAYKKFYMHNLIHFVGLDVHDVGYYNDNQILKKNMVIAVEPAIYIPFDNNIPNKYQGIGIRIEDTIIITHNSNENITNYVVKDPKLIESLMI